MKWDEVFEVHRKQNAVYGPEDLIKSMLFSEDSRRNRKNEVKGNTLWFCFPPNMNKHDYDLLMDAKKEDKKFTVYRKFGVNDYRNIGKHKITKLRKGNDKHGRESIIFHVEPA